MFKHLGSTDPRGERGGEATKQKTLDAVREIAGEEMYQNIIKKLARGNISDLSNEERAVVDKLKENLH
mgnify:FL=1